MASLSKRYEKWTVRYDYYDSFGKRHQKRVSFKKRTEAIRFLHSTELKKIDGVFVDPQKITVQKYLNDWLVSRKTNNSIAKNTYSGYKTNINHINKYIGLISLQSLTPLDIENAYSKLGSSENENLSGTSLLYIHRTLNVAFKKARYYRLIEQNPCIDVPSPKKNKFEPKFYTPSQVEDLLKVAKNDDTLHLPIVLAVTRGLRRNEILALRWEDIDFKNNVIKIRNSIEWENKNYILGKPKTESSIRDIPLSPKLSDLLLNYRDKRIFLSKFVCTFPDGRLIKPRNLSKKYNVFLKKNSFPSIRLHDLRHTAASLMFKEGVPIEVISKILGHSSIKVTMDIYLHIFTSLKEEAGNKMDAYL